MVWKKLKTYFKVSLIYEGIFLENFIRFPVSKSMLTNWGLGVLVVVSCQLSLRLLMLALWMGVPS